MLAADDLQCLKIVALLGGCDAPVPASTQRLGAELGVSPQTVSRRVRNLEDQGFIFRQVRADGQEISVTEKGVGVLRQEFADYCRLFGKKGNTFRLTGTVVTGLGEGGYYMSLPPYRNQFQAHLGFEPYPGTLNLKLTPQGMQARRSIAHLPWIPVHGFVADGRTFGEVKILPCRIGTVFCAIVLPGRSHYPEDIIEVIAPVPMRRELGLKDSDAVTVEVEP